MKNLEKINSRLRKALSRIGKRKVKKLSQSEALNAIRPYVRKTFFRLLETQVKINGVKRRGRRWSPEHRQFALNLYFHGPKAYRHLSRLLDMPTVRSLKQWLSNIPMTPGVIPTAIEALEEATRNWHLTDRACTLIFDEMSLKEHLQYDAKHDIVMGFSDDGRQRTPAVANSALLILVAGISKTWIQPVAYTVSRTKTPADTLHHLIITLIKQLQGARLFVKALICDQGGSNITLASKLGVTPEEPFFVLEGRKIYFLYDTPHLNAQGIISAHLTSSISGKKLWIGLSLRNYTKARILSNSNWRRN